MIPTSMTLLWLSLAGGALAFILFGWAFFGGAFHDALNQATDVFDEHDLKFERPWESDEQKLERVKVYGPLVEPRKGEWGEAS